MVQSGLRLKQYIAGASLKNANGWTDEVEAGTDEEEAATDNYAEQQQIKPGDLEHFKFVEVQCGLTLTCDFCTGKSFNGQYKRRSWRRHMAREHSDRLPNIPCPEGCDRTFVHWRTDNVKRHLDKHHR